jgi:hypothetical protein
VSRDPVPDGDDPGTEQGGDLSGRPDGPGRLRTTDPKLLLTCFLGGLVAGWAVRLVFVQLGATAPRVTPVQVLTFYLMAGVLAVVARGTRRTVRLRRPLRPREAVNRLVLAKACAITAALAAGGYAGYALSWAGVEAQLSSERIAMSVAAAVGAGLAVGASLLLERACRVRGGDGEP